MAYYVEPTDRENLPAGRDWMFLEEPNGDCRFVVARDAGPVLMSKPLIATMAEALARGEYLTPQMLGSRKAS